MAAIGEKKNLICRDDNVGKPMIYIMPFHYHINIVIIKNRSLNFFSKTP